MLFSVEAVVTGYARTPFMHIDQPPENSLNDHARDRTKLDIGAITAGHLIIASTV